MLRSRIKNSIRTYPLKPSGGGFVGLLDTYGGAPAAYSVRRLSSTYTGALIEVRRSSDNTTQDIGYDVNGDIDTTALLSFVGAGNGFVRTWYDQSGNANNVQQTTTSNQPKIVNTGSLVTENGKAAITSDTEWLNGPISIGEITAFSLFVVGKNKDTTITNAPLVGLNSDGYSGGDRWLVIRKLGTEMQFPVADGNSTSTKVFSSLNANQNLYSGFYVEGGLQNTSQNGVLTVSSNTSSGVDINSTIDFFALNNAGTILATEGGGLQEVIFYNSDQSSNRTGIETNINDYYSIY